MRGLLLVLAVLFAAAAWAQGGKPTSSNKEALKHYQDGEDCMRRRDAACTLSNMQKAAAADPAFIEPRIYLAELNEERRNSEEAIRWYKEVLSISKGYFPPASLVLGELLVEKQQYAEAEPHFKWTVQNDRNDSRKARAQLGLANCRFAVQALQKPVPFNPKNLGKGVNTERGEYYPCMTIDGSTLIFTRVVNEGRHEQEDFYVSDRHPDGSWGEARPVSAVNTRDYNEGAGTLTPDGRFIIFTKCATLDGTYGNGLKGYGSCDLFISRRTGDIWSAPQNLGAPVNSRAWETQPSMASDGRTLYFVRGTHGGGAIQEMDIYVTRMDAAGKWSVPVKIPGKVNTPFQEESVHIHPDGETLYFSSNGHPGMGGLDIFVSRLQDDATWGEPVNLGYPINTAGNENSLVVAADGALALMASDRAGGFGDLDIYGFELPEHARAGRVSFIKGSVVDALDGKPLEGDVEIQDLLSGRLVAAAISDPVTGGFMVCLPAGKEYALNATAEGYLFHSANYNVPANAELQGHTLDVRLVRPVAGSTISLRNIFFATASYELLPSSRVELDRLVHLLRTVPEMRVEVGGHTDDVGADADNLKLSQQRAEAVRNYAVEKGIDAGRLVAKGYGETKPVAANTSDAGRAQNRRTEITVL